MDKKIFIIGPTASGKTDLAKFIYDKFKTEIISVDSAQVYQDMNIGSAKLSPSELKKYPHHLINLIKPTENYSVARFKSDELEASKSIYKNKNIPLLVGGTMLYFNSLEFPIDNIPSSSSDVRKKVDIEVEEFGLDNLYQKLKKIDPEFANKTSPSDKQRLMRAMEVFYISGKPISSFQKLNKTPQNKFNFLKIGLMPIDRGELHKQIELRTKKMIDDGFINEVEGLIEKYPSLDKNHASLRSVGYRHIFNTINKKINLEELEKAIVVATRQLAKRQMTWMRSMNDLRIFNPYDKKRDSLVAETVEKFIES